MIAVEICDDGKTINFPYVLQLVCSHYLVAADYHHLVDIMFMMTQTWVGNDPHDVADHWLRIAAGQIEKAMLFRKALDPSPPDAPKISP